MPIGEVKFRTIYKSDASVPATTCKAEGLNLANGIKDVHFEVIEL